MADNAFTALGAPPAGEDPEAQLAYLRQVVEAFRVTQHPRLRPLGKKLEAALERLAREAQRSADAEKLARQFGADVAALQVETFDLLLTILNQARGTIRVKLQQGMPPPKRADTEKLQQALGQFAQGLRKYLSASKKGDAAGRAAAGEAIDQAGRLMGECGAELEAG